jgi:hypothetical protein
MTQAKQALAAISPYLSRMTFDDAHAKRVRLWREVIQSAAGYDHEASAEADPSDTNEVAVFADGSRLWWNHSLEQWEAGP